MWILYIVAALTAAILLFLSVLAIFHRIRLSTERKLLKAPGQLVEVDGRKMHVYLEGDYASDNAPLLVFLVGSGDPFPTFTFRPLYVKLSANHRVALVERAGVGYSEDTIQPRDIDTILSETREALSLVGEGSRKYILLPHSAAGLEALRWAQTYPYEILGIVGIDMAVPQAVLSSKFNPALVKLVNTFAYLGIHRMFGIGMMNGLVDLSAIETYMTTQDKEQLRLLFNRNLYKNEGKETPHYLKSAQLIQECGVPNVPMILFCSDKFEMMGSKPGSWFLHQSQFSLEHNAPFIRLEAGHLLMSEKPEIIAQQAHEFVAAVLHE